MFLDVYTTKSIKYKLLKSFTSVVHPLISVNQVKNSLKKNSVFKNYVVRTKNC